ncbi:MAG TPA: phophatidylserine decarboxylase associated domain-containing protein [Mycobacterium sp.]|nr:phophatidylserine decarboxylase associated domain-containing protein [Mycobacterium sp.]
MADSPQDRTAIYPIHDYLATDPRYPFNLQSGWLPQAGSPAIQAFFDYVREPDGERWADSVRALSDYIDENEIIEYLVASACRENRNVIEAHQGKEVGVPRIKDKDALLNGFNKLLKHPPGFVNNELVGVPFSAWVAGIDPTISGATLLRLPMFNEKMSAILNDWHKFLDTPESNTGFRVDGEQWLSPAAKKRYDFDIWKKDSPDLPYWKSWNSFFTRQFEHPKKERPVAHPKTNRIVNSPNDGSLFRWQPHASKRDVFWFKDMRYSIADILSSPIPKQQAVIDKYKLVDLFDGGYVFQTYLNPYNFHRWWCPANGEVLFDPLAIPGAFFNKLVIPDFAGATTASLPYLTAVNARGLIVFKTADYGYICCIPLGMSEISTITFDPKMKKGATVTKGQEMGTFNYGGSSFAVLYQNLPGKRLFFINADGIPYDQTPVLPHGSASTGGEVTLIGSQIGMWVDI